MGIHLRSVLTPKSDQDGISSPVIHIFSRKFEKKEQHQPVNIVGINIEPPELKLAELCNRLGGKLILSFWD